ncbi:MAG: hypothetical protein M1275_03280 [Patescibacteria group bacterium]|nr:hypothetical protein [Patescibacteria group bacterium]
MSKDKGRKERDLSRAWKSHQKQSMREHASQMTASMDKRSMRKDLKRK